MSDSTSHLSLWSQPLQRVVPRLRLPSPTFAFPVPDMHLGLHRHSSWVCWLWLFLMALALFLGAIIPRGHPLCHFLITVTEDSHGAHHRCTEPSNGETARSCLKRRGESPSSLFLLFLVGPQVECVCLLAMYRLQVYYQFEFVLVSSSLRVRCLPEGSLPLTKRSLATLSHAFSRHSLTCL